MKFTPEFWLGLLGAISGTSSLLLQFFDYWRTKARLVIKEDFSANSYLFDRLLFRVEGYKSDRFAAVPLIITNTSSSPITISSIMIKQGNQKSSHRVLDFHPYDIPLQRTGEDSSDKVVLDVPKSFILPIRIDSFDVISGTAVFPFLDKFVLKDNKLNATVTVHTALKKFEIKVNLFEYEEVAKKIFNLK